MQVEAVVLDIGNVLVRWDPEGFYDAHYGEDRRRALFEAVPIEAMNERIDRGEPWEALVRETAEAHPDFAAEISDWHGRWLEMFGPAIPHTVSMMRELRSKGVPVHALTNFGRETFEIARAEYPFLAEFDHAFVSAHLGALKPEPRIYEIVEEETGLDPATILYTDDRAENVAAAAERGWGTHHFTGPEGLAGRLVEEGLLGPAEAAPG